MGNNSSTKSWSGRHHEGATALIECDDTGVSSTSPTQSQSSNAPSDPCSTGPAPDPLVCYSCVKKLSLFSTLFC